MTNLTQLDDATAQRILTTMARVRSKSAPTDLTGLDAALATEFGIAPQSTSVSPGELARQSLLVLAEDPDTRKAIESMAGEDFSTARNTYDGGTSIALGLAAYYALSTALDVKVDSGGKWSFRMRVKPAGEATVKALVQKLISYLP
jgi:hypothetical protein